MRTKLVVANWKMYKTVSEALAFADEFLTLGPWGQGEAAICPPYPCLGPLAQVLEGSEVSLGAQNLHWEKEGAFTGEVSGCMLKDLTCKYVIVGHSERRQIFGEDDEKVSRKVKAAYDSQLVPIVCVGESLEERQSGDAARVVLDQLAKAVSGLSESQLSSLVVAYEPVWAIGTGHSATPEDAIEMANKVREAIGEKASGAAADSVRFLYGGSVKPGNAAGFLVDSSIDGALVGGASLEPRAFWDIIVSSGR